MTNVSNIRNNVVEQVLHCISILDTHRDAIQAQTEQSNDARQLRERSADMLQEIKIVLCNLITGLITAPVSGRMFIPLPPAHVTEADKALSLQQQLQQRAA